MKKIKKLLYRFFDDGVVDVGRAEQVKEPEQHGSLCVVPPGPIGEDVG